MYQKMSEAWSLLLYNVSLDFFHFGQRPRLRWRFTVDSSSGGLQRSHHVCWSPMLETVLRWRHLRDEETNVDFTSPGSRRLGRVAAR